jgi:hypothetical protein
MTDTDREASVGRTLADARWRGRGVDNAIRIIEDHPEHLTQERIERLRALVDEPKAGA